MLPMPPQWFPSRTLVRTAWAMLLVAAAALSDPVAFAAEPSRCTDRLVPTDSQDVTCRLDASMIGKPLHFVARFTGSHDDTRMKLAARLDGEPLVCEAGSKTSLVAEDGEVSLDCRFKAPGGRTTDSVLKVDLTVHHAQFLSAELVVE